jgi:uridylate kinase
MILVIKPQFKRVLLKISGETFLGKREYGIDPEFVVSLASQIKEVHQLGVQIAIVVGGGNIFRGLPASKHGLERVTADYMGMLATVLNALALRSALEQVGAAARVMTAIEMRDVAEPYIYLKAIRHMEKDRVVILGGGSGLPYMTTDTPAVLRALELKCNVILKATKVDGVFDKDPIKYKEAKKFETISFLDALNNKNIKVMDASALSLCMENKLPVIVFNLLKAGNIKKIILGEKVGTLVNSSK